MGSTDHKESIVAFHHADDAWKTEVTSVMDSTRDYGFYGDANLGDFLSRPVRIAEYDWNVVTGSFSASINPWKLFVENSLVRNRIEGYRLLQGKLHLRIAINGGPFFYGRAIAAYQPRHNDNDHSFLTNEALIMQYSMLPHVYLDPTSSEGGEILCPFLCPDNWLDLTGTTVDDMGELYIQSVNNLLHANASSGTVGISVYAWMEGSRLAAPTVNNYATYDAHSGIEPTAIAGASFALSFLAAIGAYLGRSSCTYSPPTSPEQVQEPQAGGDEYGTGIISKPASAVAKMMGVLAEIPVIKPFARPSELVASTIGRVAHVFGYSRPAIISDIHRFKNKGTGNLANTDAHEAVVKLTLDSKQELSVDPRTVGLSDVDEMSFDYIKMKEAYLSTINWNESDNSGSELARLSVGPDQHNVGTLGGLDAYVVAPMYSIAIPFKFWRGTIKFRFQIVASQLHRGRLRFSYDPYFFPTTADPDENAVYSRIIDLSTNRDFEMEISWNHARSWLKVRDRLDNGASGSFGHPAGTNGISFYEHNGMIRVSVVNELTSPDPALAQPVYINCFASAGEDFEVASPNDEILNQLEFEPQGGGMEPQADGEELIEEADNIPETPQDITPIGSPEGPANPNSHVFFGERFASIRALLKRYCYHQILAEAGGYSSFFWIESNFPVEPGQSVVPRHVTDLTATPASTAYNFTPMTYLNYFTPMFTAWRGGLRSKYVASAPAGCGKLYVRRTNVVPQSICATSAAGGTGANESLVNDAHLGIMGIGYGSDLVTPPTDGALEVEFPFYSNKRFAPARKFLDGSDLADDGDDNWRGNNFGHVGYAMFQTNSQMDNAGQYVTRFVAAADDFSLFMFVGAPPMIRRTKPFAATGLTKPIV